VVPNNTAQDRYFVVIASGQVTADLPATVQKITLSGGSLLGSQPIQATTSTGRATRSGAADAPGQGAISGSTNKSAYQITNQGQLTYAGNGLFF